MNVGEIRVPGLGGLGDDDESLSKCIKESDDREGSVCAENKFNGSLPVDENNDTMLGCIDDAKIDCMFNFRKWRG